MKVPMRRYVRRFRSWRKRVQAQAAFERLVQLRARGIGGTRREAAPGSPALIVGALRLVGGISGGARLMLAELRRRGVACQALDVSREIGLGATEAGDFPLVPGDALPPLPRVVHLNPPHFARMLSLLGPQVFDEPVVGYWAWELECAPPQWRASATLTDEIWVPSPFVAAAVAAMLDGLPDPPRVRVVPHPVEAGAVPSRDPAQRAAARQRLALGDAVFVAGFSFSMRAGVLRKNPQGPIAAFRDAFPAGNEPAALLLRCVDPQLKPEVWQELAAAAGGDTRVRLLGPEACRIADFYAALDALLSLHRSEGYGLTLAEALAAGIPVVATAWSLPPEIGGHPLFRGVPSTLVPVRDPEGSYAEFTNLRWADPDPAAAARYLLELAGVLRPRSQPLGREARAASGSVN
jgi:glycosyltransferase involved in cell wall biosynthesis